MTATKRYESVWNTFIRELTRNSTVTLSSIQEQRHVDKNGMKKWMESNGLSVKEAKQRVRECQHDAIPKPMLSLSEDSGHLFLPMTTEKPVSCHEPSTFQEKLQKRLFSTPNIAARSLPVWHSSGTYMRCRLRES